MAKLREKGAMICPVCGNGESVSGGYACTKCGTFS